MQVQSQPSATSSIKGFVPVAAAIASGVLLGAAFPPLAWKGLAWIGLAPLALAVRKASSVRRAFLLGMLGGFAFFLITLHPLMSASAWTGWTYESREAFALRLG
ncbi:MAG: hypothetical protein HY584_01315, partial [Candidatus Omnitrophica bacterium]|nr:hypothetical protein [Candidatus Omnitrophota bacterium]